jgi:hypothetical protein
VQGIHKRAHGDRSAPRIELLTLHSKVFDKVRVDAGTVLPGKVSQAAVLFPEFLIEAGALIGNFCSSAILAT